MDFTQSTKEKINILHDFQKKLTTFYQFQVNLVQASQRRTWPSKNQLGAVSPVKTTVSEKDEIHTGI